MQQGILNDKQEMLIKLQFFSGPLAYRWMINFIYLVLALLSSSTAIYPPLDNNLPFESFPYQIILCSGFGFPNSVNFLPSIS